MRNLINIKETKDLLESLSQPYQNPMVSKFATGIVLNHLKQKSPLKENKEFKASYPGPYHEILITEDIKKNITTLLDSVFLKIHKKEIENELKLTSVDVSSTLENSLEFITYDQGFNFFKIKTTEKLQETGVTLHNCLRHSSLKTESIYSYVLMTDESLKPFAVGKYKGKILQDLRTDYDKSPSHKIKTIFLKNSSTDNSLTKYRHIRKPSLIYAAFLLAFCNQLFVLFNAPFSLILSFLVSYSLLFLAVLFSCKSIISKPPKNAWLKTLKKINIDRFFYE